MICDHHKDVLLELAAAGVEPDPQLFAHLQACSSCSSTFENERRLFASIDSCLRSSVNAEVPSSFIPTIRAQLQRESLPAQRSSMLTDRLLWVSALAAAVIILFIFAHPDPRFNPQSRDDQLVTQRVQSPVAAPTTDANPSQRTVPPITSAIANSFAHEPAIFPNEKPLQPESRDAEVIVPPDDEILLARYAEQWSRHHHSSSTLSAEINTHQLDPLQVPLIQIAELDVKPLADQQQYEQEHELREK
jgi:hypothetical protein